MFQYHTGPIKRRDKTSDNTAIPVCFNTTLVQLKGDGGWAGDRTRTSCFNTTLVQLKGQAPLSLRSSRLRFNTTLVQLKVRCSSIEKDRCPTFQYHTGPIKRYIVTPANAPLFQGFNTTLVQLKGKIIERSLQRSLSVSIPHWSN